MFVTNTDKLHKGLVLGAERALQRGAALLLQDRGDGATNYRRRSDLRIKQAINRQLYLALFHHVVEQLQATLRIRRNQATSHIQK